MNKKIVAIFIEENYPTSLNGASRKIKNTNPRIYDALYEYTDFLPKAASFTERVFNIVAGNVERVKCDCGKVLKFKGYKTGYGKKCSKTCKG